MNHEAKIMLSMSLWRLQDWLNEAYEQGYKHGQTDTQHKVKRGLLDRAYTDENLQAFLRSRPEADFLPDWVPDDDSVVENDLP
jgi:transposase